MNEHSLDDLIIGEPTPTVKKSKSLLAIIALVVIILLFGILLSKMISGSSTDDIRLSENNETTFVSPDLIPMDTPDVGKKNKDLTPIKKEKLPPRVIKKPKPNKTTKPKEVIIKKPTVPKPITHKIIVPAKPVKSKVINKPIAKSKPKDLFTKKKPIYYIQIGAFNREPNSKFLKKIENAGLHYVIHKNEKTRRVRVGPYGSYSEAKSALSDVNNSIGIAGFVVKQK